MNTFDPRDETAAPARRARGGIGALTVALCGALAALPAGFGIGLSVILIFDGIRVREINPVDSWTDGEGVTFWILVAGVVGAVIARGVYSLGIRRYRGEAARTIGLAWLFLAGAAAGCRYGSRSLTPPLEVGRSTYLGTSEEWDTGAWFWYYLPTWLPALLLVLALLILVGSLAADRRRRARKRAGVPVNGAMAIPAEVTDAPVISTLDADAVDGHTDADPAWGSAEAADSGGQHGGGYAGGH